AFAAATWGGLTLSLAALAAVAASIWTTRALHEDGLADIADGFGGGHDRERKLAIMRDSRVGSFAVLALGISLLARVGAIT
ncbi:adenosylcobinamide-GDP ribazoletransferase, partial [Shewanella algae]|uniref:adenosylcobinamide-GDP ribazoletransferase n=1 Tax=Shewanella algae TaxID=38313 RepID=UPI00313D7E1B